ncbi:MAG: hypothetical protein ACON4Z_18375, partial [Planctomycetota bacterium]
RPRVVALLHDGNRAQLEARSPIFQGKPAGAAPSAFVCSRGVCQAPVSEPAALSAALRFASRGGR